MFTQHNGHRGELGHELVFRQIGQYFLNVLCHMSTQEWDNECCAEAAAVDFNKNNISKPAKPQTHGRQTFLNQILAPPNQLNYNKSSHYSHCYTIPHLSCTTRSKGVFVKYIFRWTRFSILNVSEELSKSLIVFSVYLVPEDKKLVGFSEYSGVSNIPLNFIFTQKLQICLF